MLNMIQQKEYRIKNTKRDLQNIRNHKRQMVGNRNQDKIPRFQRTQSSKEVPRKHTEFQGNTQPAGNRQKAFKSKDLAIS